MSVNNINQYITSFLNYCKFRNFSDNTIINYRIDLSQFSGSCLTFPVAESSEDITNWLSGFTTQSTMNRKLSTLKTFYLWAKGIANIVSYNPVENIESSKIPKRQMDYVKKSTYTDVIDSIADRNYKYNSRDKMMFDIMFNCGLRISELVSLNVTDFNFETKEFNIIGKGNKERTCYMNRTVVASVQEWLKDREALLLETGRSTNALLITKISERISVRGAQAIVENLANTHAHAFRHGFCSELAAKNINLATIADLAGHSSMSTTRRYVHSSAETMNNAVSVLED